MLSLNELVFDEFCLGDRYIRQADTSVEECVRCFESLAIKNIKIKNLWTCEEDTVSQIFEVISAFVKISTIQSLEFQKIVVDRYATESNNSITKEKLQILLQNIVAEIRRKPIEIPISVSFQLSIPTIDGWKALKFQSDEKDLIIECDLLQDQDIEVLKKKPVINSNI